MAKQTHGWQQDGWVEVAAWSSMPEIQVGLHVEVELWTRWAEPQFQFGRRHFQGPDGPPGHGIREVVKHQHEHVRPLWAKARIDYRSLFPSAGKCCDAIADPILREETDQLLQESANVGADEADTLFSCHYQSWMLLLWLWHPKYTSSAARALGHLLGIEGCTPSSDSILDQMFQKLFSDEEDFVLAHLDAWDVGFALDDEIKKMSDHNEIVDNETMAQMYPVYDKLLHDVVDSLAITDVICEITFSHSKSTLRQNMSDTRHDNDLQWVRNVLYEMRKNRREMEDKRRASKGLHRQIGVATTKMRPETCVFAGLQLVKLQQRFLPSVMKSLDIPSSTQLRRNKRLRLRCIEEAKSNKSVKMLQDSNANRRAITDDRFAELITKNREKNNNAKKWRQELRDKAALKTNDGKIRSVIKRLLSCTHWCTSRGSVRDFRRNLRLTFPSFITRLDSLRLNRVNDDDISSFWTRSGLINRSAIISKTVAGGAHGLRSYLHSIRAADFTAAAGRQIHHILMSRLKAFGCNNEGLILWFLCCDSPHLVRLLKIAVHLHHDNNKSYRKKKKSCIDRMKSITAQCGTDVSELPVMVNKGDVHLAAVVGLTELGRPTVRVFLDIGVETMVLKDSPHSDLKLGDELVVEVTNTSGGRKFLQARPSRTLKLLDSSYSSTKPVLVTRVLGLLGRTDFSTGYFVPRPDAADFLLFVSRMYTLAVWTVNEGEAIDSKIVLMHPLLFVGVGDEIPDAASMTTITTLSATNVVRLVPQGDPTVGHGVLSVPRYSGGKKDCVLMHGSELRSLLQAAASTDSAGSFISEYNDDHE